MLFHIVSITCFLSYLSQQLIKKKNEKIKHTVWPILILIPFRLAHNTCEFWDQNNSSSMDHTTNPAPLHLPCHDPHYCLDYDFLAVIKLLKERHFDLLKKHNYICLNLQVKSEGRKQQEYFKNKTL